MRFELPYGTEMVSAELDWARMLGLLDVANPAAIADIDGAVRSALARPIGIEATFDKLVNRGEKTLIIVSDSFRETRISRCLPTLLEELNRAGASEGDISFLVATGVHRGPTVDELQRILGPEVHERFESRIHVHDAHSRAELVMVGTTARGTPVEVNRRALECDRLIVTGTVVLHYFGGFGGGRKSIVPGLASAATISRNHSLNLDPVHDRLNPRVRIGVLDGNPVAEDLLEAAKMVKVDLILNTVLNRDGEIAALFAGELEQAHRAAAEYARNVFTVPIREQADLVIASAGGAKNFIQAHKALYNAYQAMKPGGRVIFLAKCAEGLGAERFTHWLRLGTVQAVIAELRKNSEINGQTALSTLGKAPDTIIVTDMPQEQAELLHMTRAANLGEALDIARGHLGARGELSCYLMPSASYSVPVGNA